MKKFFTIFFVTLGVIFFIIILIGSYFFITDPFNLKPLLFGGAADVTTAEVGAVETIDKHPLLSPAQESALETVGIDPANVPSEITPTQEECFVEKIGSARVAEIKAGDSPTALEIIKGKDCI